MCSSNRAKLSEFIGCFLLYNFKNIFDLCNHGLCRYDGLIIMDDFMPRKGDIIRKKLHCLFNKFGFKLDIKSNLKVTDYLHITFNLYNGTVAPFRKNNQVPSYIKTSSNYPKQVFKCVLNGIMVSLPNNSSNHDNFTENKHKYEATLKNSGYKSKLVYKSRDEVVDLCNRNNRGRKIS